MKIGAFISTCVTFVLSMVAAYLVYKHGTPLPLNGLEGFANIIVVPLLFVGYVVLSALIISTIISSATAAFSSVVPLKIISLVILFITVVIAVLLAIYIKKLYV